jgi:DNA-binding MarR family transcriptional regulator/N-acetylglutamate synthase-like GNAT family acetyltransferase
MRKAGSGGIQNHVAAVRRFNRFYTQHIGVLHDGWLDSPFSLTEARVLYEIRERLGATATEIGRDLGLDAGYMSRILRRFNKSGLIRKETSPDDGRQSFLSLTARGEKAFAPLEDRTVRQVGAMLGRLTRPQQDQLVDALQTAEVLMSDRLRYEDVVLREPRPGDLGWVVERHAVLYAQEYGWTGSFEGVCARIVADFQAKFDPAAERCWIAEIANQRVGSVFLVRDSDRVARLRLLLVEPSARGVGIGKRLTDECIRFARDCGYERITLWTHSILTAARHIYAEAGFSLTSSEKKHSFGKDVISEYWDLTL